MELWEKHLGRNYELVDVLKKTQDGTVALVYDKIGKQVCILKQMDARALETYRLIKEIKSPHVPSIYRLFLQDGNLLLIEEFIDGRTLADLLKYGETMEEDFAIHVLRELCLCLRPFHERNIIHRDIKPSNIMVTKKNEIKLIDFGIARVVKKGDEADTSFLGTKGYAPPEQYGFGQTDARSDIYALGITLRHILGKDYHGSLQDILKRCTAIDPANRYSSVPELLEALEQRHRKRNRKRIALLCLISSLLLPGILLWETLQPSSPPPEHTEEQAKPAKSTAPEEIPVQLPPENPPAEQQKAAAVPELQIPPLPAQEARSEPSAPSAPSTPPNPSDTSASPVPKKDPRTNRVFGTLYLNGAPYGEDDVSIPTEEWDGWQQEGDFTYFPSAWSMHLHLENGWEKDYVNPVLCVTINQEDYTVPLPTIRSGEAVDVPIPLDRASFSSALCYFDILVSGEEEPPNAPPLHWTPQFYLSGWARHRMELSQKNHR